MFKKIFVLLLFICSYAQAGVLKDLLEEAQGLAQYGYRPVFVMDLDETIIDSQDRKIASVREALTSLNVRYPEESNRASALTADMLRSSFNGYDVRGALKKMGVMNDAFLDELDKSSIAIYLSGKYMDLDTEIPGASRYLEMLNSIGAEFFFVTSRYEDKQKAGTLESLKSLSMLFPSAKVYLRPRAMSSLDFKVWAFQEVRHSVEQQWNAVFLGVFENEPENMNAMSLAFPEASAVFVTGAFIKDIPLTGHATKIKNFLSL